MWGVCAIFFSYPSLLLPCAATAFWCIFFPSLFAASSSSCALFVLLLLSLLLPLVSWPWIFNEISFQFLLATRAAVLSRMLPVLLQLCLCLCLWQMPANESRIHVCVCVCMCACHVFTYGIFKLKIFLQQNKMRRMRHQLQLISWLKVSNTFVIFEQGRQMKVCKRKLWRIMRKCAM